MSMSKVKSTGWVARNYNQRGLSPHNIITKNLVRTTKGVLWAAIRENIQSNYLRIYRSTNNGFTWQLKWQGTFTNPGFRISSVANLNTNGGIAHLLVDERRNRLLVLHSFYNLSNSKYQIEPFLFQLDSSDTLKRLTPDGGGAMYTLIDVDMDQMATAVGQNDDHIYLTYLSGSQVKMIIMRMDDPIVAVNAPNLPGTTFFNMHNISVSDDNNVDLIVLDDRGTNRALVHSRFSKAANAWGPKTTITQFPANDCTDINLERTLDGRLTAVWGQFLDGGVDIAIYYSFSTDQGATWSTPATIPTTSGHGAFTDFATGQKCTRVNALATLEGDIFITYVRSIEGRPDCFWRKLAWNGETYEIGVEQPLASNCTSAKFFRASSTNLISAQDPNNIRVGYTVGQGNSTLQEDTIPVKLRQKSLLEGLFIDENAYAEDEAAENQLEVYFSILGAPNENLDFYAEGVVGATTYKYITAFNKVGTSIRLQRWEPNPASYMGDKSAYQLHSEHSIQAVFQSLNYEMPVNVSGTELFQEYIEKDTRRLFIPPYFHLARNFVLNLGEHLKRTVWIAVFDGNEYELSQIVPHFFDNQIAYYSCNAYVIGPSNDPFSKQTLPTET